MHALLHGRRKDRLIHYGGHHIKDWGDLLQPKLKGKLALADFPRELLAAALKSLGLSVNASPADMAAAGVSRQALRARLQQLRSQARLLSSKEHVRALMAGEACGMAQQLWVGSSGRQSGPTVSRS